jgi:urease accessory protein
MNRSALLLLADSRLPAGGHAHSGGLEEAVAAGRVTSVADLAAFLHGRLATTGLVAAAFAAAAAANATFPTRLADLDTGYDARTASPALRKASRAQGRALLRAGNAMWPIHSPAAAPDRVWPSADGPNHAVALGVVAFGAGLLPADAALVATYGVVTGPASAAVRLLGLDPYAVQAVLAGLASECDVTAARATATATAAPGPTAAAITATSPAHTGPAADVAAITATGPADAAAAWAALVRRLPAATAPLLDIGAECHARWEVRLFAS